MAETTSMRDNLVFNVTEFAGAENTEVTLREFLKNDMKIVESRTRNKITFDSVNISGPKPQQRSRIIVEKSQIQSQESL